MSLRGILNTCVHADTSPPDGDGTRLCVSCGATVPNLEASVFQTIDALHRDGHSSRCVRTEHGYVCATGCRRRARR